jgi:hypothetical protein
MKPSNNTEMEVKNIAKSKNVPNLKKTLEFFNTPVELPQPTSRSATGGGRRREREREKERAKKEREKER